MNKHFGLDSERWKYILEQYPMGANKLLERINQAVEERYQREKAAIEILARGRPLKEIY